MCKNLRFKIGEVEGKKHFIRFRSKGAAVVEVVGKYDVIRTVFQDVFGSSCKFIGTFKCDLISLAEPNAEPPTISCFPSREHNHILDSRLS